jgi:hypothetical protein
MAQDNTYNVNRNVANFGDYCNNFEKEKEELKKVKRSINPNTPDTQKYPKNSRYKYNRITRKMDDLTPDIIDDQLKSMEDVKESRINESSIDYDVLHKIKQLPAYNKLKEEFRNSIDTFVDELQSSADEIGYDEGDTDHDMAFNAAIQEILDELIGW